jgi:HEAT repeat protein
MGDPDGAVRIQGVQGLAHWRDLDDVPGFVALLDDDVPGVRQGAAAALAKVYDRGAIQALAEHLDDPDLNVRETIFKTLEAIKKAEEAKDYWKKFAEER